MLFLCDRCLLQKCEVLESQLLAAAGRISESQNAAAAAQEETERLRNKLSETTKTGQTEHAKLREALQDKDKVCLLFARFTRRKISSHSKARTIYARDHIVGMLHTLGHAEGPSCIFPACVAPSMLAVCDEGVSLLMWLHHADA